MYLLIYKIDGFIEETGGSKYLNIAITDNNDEVLKKYMEVLSGINSDIYMKIKFDSNDKLP